MVSGLQQSIIRSTFSKIHCSTSGEVWSKKYKLVQRAWIWASSPEDVWGWTENDSQNLSPGIQSHWAWPVLPWRPARVSRRPSERQGLCVVVKGEGQGWRAPPLSENQLLRGHPSCLSLPLGRPVALPAREEGYFYSINVVWCTGVEFTGWHRGKVLPTRIKHKCL